jgi:hypothetical protein
MAAKCRGATAFYRAYGAALGGRERSAMPVAENLAEVTEDIRHLQSLSGHGARASGGHEIRHHWLCEG